MKYVSAIVLAAGRGLRLAPCVSKPLVKIDSQPLIIYCLKTLSSHPCIKDIVVVANLENKVAISREIKKYGIAKVKNVILGGTRRQDSVLNGLKALDKRSGLVLIHDGVRPFIEKHTISAAIKETLCTGAAIVGVPVKTTIKEVTKSQSSATQSGGPAKVCGGHKVTSRFVVKTLDRERLYEIQTPQVFRRDLILEAYKKFASQIEVTDDAMLVERLGIKVSIVSGSYNNIKITTPEDLVLAQGLAKKWNTG